MIAEDQWVWVPFEVDKRFEGLRVDQFLAQRLTSYSRSKVQKILAEGRILTDGRPTRASHKVHQGEKILIAYPRRPEEPLTEDVTLPVLFEDDDFLIINKPSNLLSHPTDKIQIHTVTHILRHTRKDVKQFHLLHRLDRETSGVLALAKTTLAARRWTQAMERRQIHKEYIAFVRGIPKPRKGIINHPIGRQGAEIKVRQAVNVPDAAEAVTRYEVLSCHSRMPLSGIQRRLKSHWIPDDTLGDDKTNFAVIRASPETGRLHQIRVHMASIGHPILGDMLYQDDGEVYLKMIRKETITEADYERLGFPRLALHAHRLSFTHPITQKALIVVAPLPDDMERFQRRKNHEQSIC